MGKQRMAQPRRKPDRRLRRKILCRDRTDQTDHRQQHQRQTHPHNIRSVFRRDPRIDYRRHNQRNNQLK